MRVTFIIPPSGFLLDDKVFMSLGVLKVAAVLEQNTLHSIEVLDLSGDKDPVGTVLRHVESSRSAHVYGITATTAQLPFAVKIADVLTGYDTKIILGGPHVTLVNAAAKGEKKRGETSRASAALFKLRGYFDVLIAGDGELAIEKALDAPPGTLIDADDSKSEMFLKSLDNLPLPSRHLIDVDSYHFYVEGERALSIIAQLGCPFGCGFCGGRLSPTFRQIRSRSAQDICVELQYLYNTYGIKAFMFLDDEVNVTQETLPMLDAIASLQDKLKVRFKLRGHIKAQLLNDRQADALVKAGFSSIFVGFESGDHRILENIQKRSTREENSRCMAIARAHGIKVKALMSIGHPGESPFSVEETKNWLLEEKPDDFGLTVITTYPGTPYYDFAKELKPGVWTYTCKNGDNLHAYDVDFLQEQAYFKGARGSYKSFVYTDYLSSQELVSLRDAVEQEVREKLNIPWPTKSLAQIEQSMGQTEPIHANT
jgi:radical SAM superfamily enzyme YgiQ (UPF0313 family)